jgi:hypothetical protein
VLASFSLEEGKREEGREGGKREEGRGKREEGRGKREEGRGKREEGRGKRKEQGGRGRTHLEKICIGHPRASKGFPIVVTPFVNKNILS